MGYFGVQGLACADAFELYRVVERRQRRTGSDIRQDPFINLDRLIKEIAPVNDPVGPPQWVSVPAGGR
jgi:hypothetical protein